MNSSKLLEPNPLQEHLSSSCIYFFFFLTSLQSSASAWQTQAPDATLDNNVFLCII